MRSELLTPFLATAILVTNGKFVVGMEIRDSVHGIVLEQTNNLMTLFAKQKRWHETGQNGDYVDERS